MIARYQSILFGVLVAASIVMGFGLWRQLDRAHQRLLKGQDSAPTQAPQVAPAVQVTLLVANDTDDSLQPQTETLPLPQDPGAGDRLILGKLFEIYSAPDAAHPVPNGNLQSIAQVFLMPAPSLASATPVAPLRAGQLGIPCRQPGRSYDPMDEKVPCAGAVKSGSPNADTTGPQLAVVNLTSAFVATHPSGLETETLTLESICGTLHANQPRITQVRFLVDGQVKPTLAGHADLTRTYLAADAAPTAGANPQ